MRGFDPEQAKNYSDQLAASKKKKQSTAAAQAAADAGAAQTAADVAVKNQQPDTVPMMGKPGEFVLPVDTVHALGGADVLDSVVQATHTPAPEAAVVPEGFSPEYFFNNGGRVPGDERNQAPASQAAAAAPAPAPPAAAPAATNVPPKQTSPTNIYPQSSPSAGAEIYKGAGFRAEDFGSSGKIAQPPASMQRRENTTFDSPAPQARPARDPSLANVGMSLPQDSAPVGGFASPEVRASLSVPKPAIQPAQAEDPMAGKAAFGFHPGITASAERPPAGVPTATTPTTAAPSTSAVPMGAKSSPTAMYVDDATADVGKRWDQGDVAGAAGAAVRTAVGTVGMAGIEALDNTVTPVAKGVGKFWDGLVGNAAAATPAAAPAAVPAATSAGAVQPRAPAAQVAPAAPTAAPTQAAANVSPSATVVPVPGQPNAPAIYNHGRGQYSDNAAGMGFSAGFTGRPNAQNLQAASNLSAQRPSASSPSVSSQQPVGGFRSPTVAHSGNDFSARKRLENLKTSASSITNQSRWGGGRRGEVSPAVQAYLQAVNADLAAQGKQPEVDVQTNAVNAGVQREQIQQSGATTRAAMGERTASQRVALDERRVEGEETTRGFQTRAAQQLEAAQQSLMAAKTPAEQETAAKKIRALMGKSDDSNYRDRFLVVGGGQEWEDKAGAMRNVPQRVIDLATQREVGGFGTRPSNTPALEVGKVYEDGEGNKRLYTKEGFKPL